MKLCDTTIFRRLIRKRVLQNIFEILSYDSQHIQTGDARGGNQQARLAQSVERLALNQVVVGSSPTVGVFFGLISNLLRQNI